MLARSGMSNLLVVDDDVVGASNLNRQHYWPRHVGRPKVEALAELLLELNPAMQVETRRMRMDQHNIATVLPACPIWVEAFDGPDDKTLLVETALLGGYRIASAGHGRLGRQAMGKRYLGNLVLVGDFSTDVLLAPPWPRALPRQRPCWPMLCLKWCWAHTTWANSTSYRIKKCPVSTRLPRADHTDRTQAGQKRGLSCFASKRRLYTLSWAVRSSSLPVSSCNLLVS